LQVHRFDEDTYIIRQNKCVNFEAPFIYLLIGRDKALLLDSGAPPAPGRTLPLRETVRQILATRLGTRRAGDSFPLIVAHSHRHPDHVYGDGQFRNQPRTTVVGKDENSVRSFFRFINWPEHPAAFDLGGRTLTVIPVPGHDPTHIALYDPKTRILFTGDTFYPGMLFIQDWDAYRLSIARLAEFALSNPISYILGAHVEMTNRPRVSYPYRTTYQPDEHVLELKPTHLFELRDACEAIGARPRRDARDSFIIEPQVQ
jgi:glyoxylase-like metal-dependent hydrolase (beta-lactamase superfamily II)